MCTTNFSLSLLAVYRMISRNLSVGARWNLSSRQTKVCRTSALLAAIVLSFIGSTEVFARVGGGQSYGGGSHGSGDGGGGGIIWLVFQAVRFLIYLTIEYPAVGIPLDIVVICGVAYYFVRRAKAGPDTFSSAAAASPLGLDTAAARQLRGGFVREFEQLRKFDPNFSEIVFTDFC